MSGSILRGTRLLAAVLGLCLVAAGPARASGNPDFDAVTWTPLGCDNSNLISHTSPAAADFVGDATFPAAYFSHDASYLYFRYRMNGDPGSFAQYSWTALMQVPTGNPFQYQYQLSLYGKTNTIEIWHNTVASDISFSPLFHDDAEVQLFSQQYNLANGSTVNTTPLARSLPTGDGSAFGGNTDYFVDFAFPVSAMMANGLISGASDLDESLFFPATSTNPNNYNKGYLNCPFLPGSTLSVEKSVLPTSASANVTTPITYTIAVQNDGPGIAKGIEIDDPALPAYMTSITASVSADDPSVVWTVVSTNPLQVKVDSLPNGATITVDLSANATPGCAVGDFTNTATAWGVNSMQVSGSAVLHAGTAAAEVCDGVDNNCNGQVDEGGAALCDDGNPCTVDSCGGQSGCSHDPIPGCVPCATPSDCDDGNACTTDTCDGGVCGHTAIPGCTLCTTPSDCDDGNACTTDTCDGGVCGHTAIAGCAPCATDGDCNDGMGCTTDACVAGACSYTAIPGCVPCESAADCTDQNGCTTDICSGDHVCQHEPQASCIPCTTAADCNDQNPCTTDQCGPDGSCQLTTIPGCQRCTTTADCDDGDSCTTDTCTGGTCAHTAVPDCPATPPHEICGNCVDDDGNGLTDYEDPACCSAELPLAVKRMVMKSIAAKLRGNRLRLKARYAPDVPALFNPMTQDTTIQVSDPSGQLFCHTVGAANWKHPHRRLYSFKDKTGSFAGGLATGRFKVKRSGIVMFRTRGKRVELRPADGNKVLVTIRVGNQCARETMSLRTSKKKALVFP